jgi:tRNA(Ile)-lysidine synthase
LNKYELLDKKLLLAFSGGWDSMCLLDILAGLNVVAIHLNHNWRGDESAAEAEVCLRFCQERGVEFYTETIDVARTETAAREARYEFFERCAEKFGADAVLTAHNYDDNAETLLYRIIKGTGIRGLRGIEEQRGIYYRPLLSVPRAQIEEYCHENGLCPNTDSSNFDTKHKRNLIRQEVLPLLKQINPDVVKSLNSLSQVAAFDNQLIDEYAAQMPLKDFHQYSDALKSRLIYKIFIDNRIDYDRTRINIILDFIEQNKTAKPAKTVSLTTGMWIAAGADGIKILDKVRTK